MPEILKLYKNIAYFKQQGVEKYNDIVSKDHFRSFSHREIFALEQLFFEKQRIQFLEAADCERVKKSVTCFNCQGQDRTINKRQSLQKRSGAFRIENRFLSNFAQESTLV